MVVKVSATAFIKTQFSEEADFQEFVAAFTEWKEAGAAGENDFIEFGKDSWYERPERDVVRHVHLLPITDPDQLNRWKDSFYKFPDKRRTSNRILVYCEKLNKYTKLEHYLLIAILDPRGHEIGNMETKEDKELMLKLFAVADDFIHKDQISF